MFVAMHQHPQIRLQTLFKRFLLKLLTGTNIVVAIVGMVVVDVDLAIVRIEVDIRHIAIAIARTRSLLSDFIHFTDNLFQNYLRLTPLRRGIFL